MGAFMEMNKRPAKNPAETRKLITELEQRAKYVEDLDDTPLDTRHKKSVLVAILDPETKKHTVNWHGSGTSYMELRNEAMRFVNAVGGVPAGDPMQIGAFAGQPGQWDSNPLGNNIPVGTCSEHTCSEAHESSTGGHDQG